MSSSLRKCPSCGCYTTKEICGCGSKTVTSQPPRFSPEDKYGEYRRKGIVEEYGENGKYNNQI